MERSWVLGRILCSRSLIIILFFTHTLLQYICGPGGAHFRLITVSFRVVS